MLREDVRGLPPSRQKKVAKTGHGGLFTIPYSLFPASTTVPW